MDYSPRSLDYSLRSSNYSPRSLDYSPRSFPTISPQTEEDWTDKIFYYIRLNTGMKVKNDVSLGDTLTLEDVRMILDFGVSMGLVTHNARYRTWVGLNNIYSKQFHTPESRLEIVAELRKLTREGRVFAAKRIIQILIQARAKLSSFLPIKRSLANLTSELAKKPKNERTDVEKYILEQFEKIN